MKTLIMLALVSLSSLSGAYASSSGFGSESFLIDLKTTLSDLDLEVSKHQTGRTAIVAIQNNTPQTGHCRARFHIGPELPRWREGSVAGSEHLILAHTAKRPVIRMEVCWSAPLCADPGVPSDSGKFTATPTTGEVGPFKVGVKCHNIVD
ncbi:hypothetical protein [Desulfuromonas sp. TF]|uniref:hypothetical protein n=1 Tax=Desulfuromonas sp. TF TaxID=1232410 RepID=UPI00048830AA|nr:hypothetical protein [Desulfuromonas sp. TF]